MPPNTEQTASDTPPLVRKKPALLALCAILFFAAGLRLQQLELVRFNADQLGLVENVELLVELDGLPLTGPPIGPAVFGWGRLGPAHYYLLAPPAAVLTPFIASSTPPS